MEVQGELTVSLRPEMAGGSSRANSEGQLLLLPEELVTALEKTMPHQVPICAYMFRGHLCLMQEERRRRQVSISCVVITLPTSPLSLPAHPLHPGLSTELKGGGLRRPNRF